MKSRACKAIAGPFLLLLSASGSTSHPKLNEGRFIIVRYSATL